MGEIINIEDIRKKEREQLQSAVLQNMTKCIENNHEIFTHFEVPEDEHKQHQIDIFIDITKLLEQGYFKQV